LDDGRLNFCLVDSLPLRRILPLIPLYKQGKHLSDPAVHCWQVTGGQIEAPSGELLGNYDGEIFQKKAIRFQIMPLGLRFAFY
jgi:diacylglycerol kinase family enzyme